MADDKKGSKKIKSRKSIDCAQCKTQSDCCRIGAWIDLEEAKKIISAGIRGDFFHLEKDKSFPSGYRIGTSHEDDVCSFLGPDGLCLIHKKNFGLKPVTCKEFPYENNRISYFTDVLCTTYRAKIKNNRKNMGYNNIGKKR